MDGGLEGGRDEGWRDGRLDGWSCCSDLMAHAAIDIGNKRCERCGVLGCASQVWW